jgi:hypothetical protein
LNEKPNKRLYNIHRGLYNRLLSHWRTLVILLLIVAIIVPVTTYLLLPSSGPPTLSVAKIYNTSLKEGQSIIVNVTVSDVSDLIACRFNLAFDPSVLSVTLVPHGLKDPSTGKSYGIYEGPFLKSSNGTTMFLINYVSVGTISEIYDAIMVAGKSSSGSGVVASINFTCIKATTYTAINVTGIDRSIALNLTGTSTLQTTTSFGIQHQALNGFITAGSPPGVWTELWFQTALIVIVIEIILVVLGIFVTIRGWRFQAEKESKESDELDELFR